MLDRADNSDVTEIVWSRYVYLFGGFEAVVFTAVGWLFGREVHRAAVETATKHAAEYKEEADAAKDEASRGRALAVAVKASAPLATQTRITVGERAAQSDFATVLRMAEELFPAASPRSIADADSPST
jgi:hypothetical protein